MTIEEYVKEHFENVPEQDITDEMCNEFALFLKMNNAREYDGVMDYVYDGCDDFLKEYFEAITDGSVIHMNSAISWIKLKRIEEFKQRIVEAKEDIEELNESELFEATEAAAINKEI